MGEISKRNYGGRTMLICNRCGDTFDEPKTKYEYHSEVDTRQYESYQVCPYCESDDIDECGRCDCCGDYIVATRKQNLKRKLDRYCVPCENLVNDLMDETIANIKEANGVDFKKAIDLIDAWVMVHW